MGGGPRVYLDKIHLGDPLAGRGGGGISLRGS